MATGVKRKRVVLSLKQKLDIINRLDQGEKAAVLATEFNVGKSSVMDIKMSKDTILKYVSSFANTENINLRKTMKCAYNKELDQAVYTWYKKMREGGQILSGPVICDKALELNVSIGGSPDFKASVGWLKNFKFRHGLVFSNNTNDSSETPLPTQETAASASDNTPTAPFPLTNVENPVVPRVKRKRIVLSLKEKLDIIYRLDKGETASCLAREYNVGQSSVKDIKMNQDAILNYVSTFASADNMYRRKTMKSAYNKDLDKAVYDYYLETVRSGNPISGPLICDKALELNKLLGGSSDFKASSGWLQNFKSRHGLFQGNGAAMDSFNYPNLCPEEVYPDIYFDSGDRTNTPEYIVGKAHGSYESDYNQKNECYESRHVVVKDESYDCQYEDVEFESYAAGKDENYESLPRCDVILNVPDDGDISVQQSSTSTNNKQLLNAFDTVLDWARDQAECSSTDVANITKLRELVHLKGMSVAFSSNESDAIHQKINTPTGEKRDESFSLEDMYEIERCIEWINSNQFTKIALQFPDNLLGDATAVALKLESLVNGQMFVLGDTSFGSCCVDEIAAEHVSADAIIHFGHACLSPTKRLPVLYIFGKHVLDVQDVASSFRKLLPDKKCRVILLYEVMFSHSIDSVYEELQDYENLLVSRLEIPDAETKFLSLSEMGENWLLITKCHRHILIPVNHTLDSYNIFYIGFRNETLTNFMLSFKNCRFYTYNPLEKLGRLETLDVNKHLKRRYYYIEKAKDAKIIGILVGTLGISNYLDIIKHLKELIKQAGKKSYTLVVGKLNNSKLANFAEIDIFVNVACIESSLIESRDFYQSIITPYELEIALNQARAWTGDYINDFSELLPGAASYIPSEGQEERESDVSLVTGKIRHAGLLTTKESEDDSNTALVPRNDMKMSVIHYQGAGEYLTGRSWQGLEQQLGETPVSEIEAGQRGIASRYEDEDKDSACT